SYINDEGSNDLLIYNYVSEDWLTIIDDSIYSSFSEHSYAIGSDYYDQDYNLKFKFVDWSPETYHQFYLDQFRIDYSYSKTGGNINADITKTINDNFLNRYDTGFSNYKKLYDITIEFDYRFTKELPQYGDLAKFLIDATEYDLIRDGSWHSFSETSEFDSTSKDSFDLKFTASNGLLELNNMDYSLVFKCIDTNDHIFLQQDFNVEYPFDFQYPIEQPFIEIDYSLVCFDDGLTYYNTFGRNDKLEIIYNIKADGLWYESV
ncbi:unnamed protein product, partial [marine sediment metagenome]